MEKIKNFLFKMKISKKNIFSSTSGLKGYKVGNKKFSASPQGYLAASKYSSKVFQKYGKANIGYIY